MELPQISESATNLVSRRTKVPLPTREGARRQLDLTVPVAASRGASRRRLRQRPISDKFKSTFDPEADYNFDSSDDEDKTNKHGDGANRGAITYARMCKKLRTVPVNSVSRQFGKSVISLENFNLGRRELKAFFVAALECYVNADDEPEESEETEEGPTIRELTQLGLGGNKVGPSEVTYLSEFTTAHVPLVSVMLNGCQMTTATVRRVADWVRGCKHLRKLDLSENNLTDADSPYIADIIENCENLRELVLKRNELGNSCARLGEAMGNNETLTSLDLSWNHIRATGAMGFANGLKNNRSLETLILAWNGFSYEGCSALGHALLHNSTISHLDLTCNRIHPPALFELLKGIEKNKSLTILKLGLNPITAPMSSILLTRLLKAKENAIKELDLEGIVVDKDFEGILKEIQEARLFLVRYDSSLPLNKGVVTQIDPKNIFNIDPIRILYFMKEHLRTIDLFLKIDEDSSNSLSRDEMKFAFEMEGFPISSTALDEVMGYLDVNKDGEVDLLCLKSKLTEESRCISECIKTANKGVH